MSKPKRRQKGFWSKLEMKYKILIGAMSFLILSAATVQAWDALGLPWLATRSWVLEIQFPVQQEAREIRIEQKKNRISTIKDLLVENENKRLAKTITVGDKKRYEIQAQDLNKEWEKLEAEIKTLEIRPRGK